MEHPFNSALFSLSMNVRKYATNLRSACARDHVSFPRETMGAPGGQILKLSGHHLLIREYPRKKSESSKAENEWVCIAAYLHGRISVHQRFDVNR